MKGRILLGICGGIAAYKIPALVSRLVQEGYRVRAVLTEAGARFASREALQALSGQTVYSSLWQEKPGSNSPVLHIALVEEADIFLVAPASYNWVGQAANGMAADLLCNLFAAWPLAQKPLLFAPAMNSEMWRKSAQNVARLQELGCQLLEPPEGFLACRAEGPGRMSEELYFQLEAQLRFPPQHRARLRGRKLLLTAGPTREMLDPVRYISNRSSGKTGIALACAARDLGARVTLVFGAQPLDRPQLFGIRLLHCDSTAEMAQIAAEHFADCDWALAVAAVCDFRPAQVQQEKSKKPAGSYQLELVPNPDILACWGQHKSPQQKVLGFALESGDGRAQARAKLHSKKADAIVLNHPDNLAGDRAQGRLIFAEADEYLLEPQDKRDFAAKLLLQLCEHWLPA